MQVEIATIVESLAEGGVVVFPTETVYALAADARNSSAIDAIYQLKQRDKKKPVAMIGESQLMVESYVCVDNRATGVMQHFMPGALTCVLSVKPSSGLADNMVPESNTLGVRVPDHALVQEIISRFGAPLAATSVNLSGQHAAVTVEEVEQFCGDEIAYCLPRNEREIPQGVASTVVNFSGGVPVLLRQGDISFEEIMRVYRSV